MTKRRKQVRCLKLTPEQIEQAWKEDILTQDDVLERTLPEFLASIPIGEIVWLDLEDWSRMSLVNRARNCGIRIATKKHPTLSAFALKRIS